MYNYKMILKRFRSREKGQGMVEYGLILAIVSIIAAGSVSGVGDKVTETFKLVTSDFIMSDNPSDGNDESVSPVVTTEERVEIEEIEFQTIVKEDSSLFTDETKVKNEGEKGEIKRIYNRQFIDGVPDGGEELQSESRKEAVDKVVLVGTMNPKWRNYLAKDSDFSGESDGGFRYTGNKSTVYIPHQIKGKNLTSYVNMFRDTSVKKVISDNSNIRLMDHMFSNTKSTELDLSDIDTSSVERMHLMFYMSNVRNLDLSGWDTQSLTNMHGMFWNSELESVNFDGWDTSSVTRMSYIFSNTNLTRLDLRGFDTSSANTMKSMFSHSSLEEIKGLSQFNTSNVTDMMSMFDAVRVKNLDVSSFDTRKVTDMKMMFWDTNSSTLDLSGFHFGPATEIEDIIGFVNTSKIYVRTHEDADRIKNTRYIPSELSFEVK